MRAVPQQVLTFLPLFARTLCPPSCSLIWRGEACAPGRNHGAGAPPAARPQIGWRSRQRPFGCSPRQAPQLARAAADSRLALANRGHSVPPQRRRQTQQIELKLKKCSDEVIRVMERCAHERQPARTGMYYRFAASIFVAWATLWGKYIDVPV